MKISSYNASKAMYEVASMIEAAGSRVLTIWEEANLIMTYAKVLQNEEEIRPVLESLRGIVA